LNDDTQELSHRIEQRTHTIARDFDRVVQVLSVLGYVQGDEVLPPGRNLARIYGELDLVTSECLRQDVWHDLSPAELAAAASVLVYEARRDDATQPKLPGGRARDAIIATLAINSDVRDLERTHRLSLTRVADTGFAWASYRWASGHRLEAILHECDLTAGDFVRWMRQLLDILGQIANATDDGPLRKTARASMSAVQRGVVSVGALD